MAAVDDELLVSCMCNCMQCGPAAGIRLGVEFAATRRYDRGGFVATAWEGRFVSCCEWRSAACVTPIRLLIQTALGLPGVPLP